MTHASRYFTFHLLQYNILKMYTTPISLLWEDQGSLRIWETGLRGEGVKKGVVKTKAVI